MSEWITRSGSQSQSPRIRQYLWRWQHQLRRLPILYRIAVGNGLIILLGAVGGTLITRHLAREAADLSLILMFAGLGILLTLIINYWIVRTALQPFYQLRQLVDRVQTGKALGSSELFWETDPDVYQLAAALHSLVGQLEDRNLKLRALSERAINAQEEERRRIARGLHDDTAQALSMLIIHLERLESSVSSDTDLQKERLIEARQLATRTLQDLRQVVLGLRPTILDDLGLVAAIRWYARSTLEPNGIRVDFEISDEVRSLPARIETTLFRIAQEAISNVVRHAETESALVTLRHEDRCTCLWVSDQGRGFDVAHTSDRALELRRLGLLGIQERAELIGGEVMVDSTPGHGTRLRVCVPLPVLGEMNEKHPDLVG